MEGNLNRTIPQGTVTPANYAAPTKSLGTAPETKGLVQPGATSQDPALVQWYEQAYAYYNAVVGGQEAQPDPSAWQNFMTQMQWAAGQLGYGQQQWDPSMGGQGGYPGMGGMPGPQQAVPPGAALGPNGNVVWTGATADITAGGDPRPQDIWSNDVSINVPSLSAKVTSELTNDTQTQPNEQVLKITVHDPATGVDSVYLVHDYADATVKINTPVKTQVTDTSAFAGISWSQYQQTGATGGTGSHPDASVSGEVVSTDTNGNTTTKYSPEFYDPTSTIDLFANPNDPGKTDTSIISYANVNISAKGDDDVVIIKDQPNPGDILVKVIHSQGIAGQESEDDYVVKNGYQTLNINGNPASVHFGTAAGPAGTDGVPAGYKGVTLNGGATTGTGTGSIDADSVLQSLESTTTRNDAQILSNLQAAGYSYISIDDFKKDIADGKFPGTPPDSKLLKFLSAIDPTLNTALTTIQNDKAATTDPTQLQAKMKTDMDSIMSRLNTLLTSLYPNNIVNVGTSAGDGATKLATGRFTIDGTNYNTDVAIDGSFEME